MRGKITSSQLQLQAHVYIRQSTYRQVFEHGESTERQYALADRARTLGWSDGDVAIIDEDLGRSGATSESRTGFARLVHAVSQGQVGAIFALEVSRLARSSEDWQRLLRLCAVAGVAVVDETAVYDPSDKDDKLLLDIKGTMAEAELHWLGLRLMGARRAKAARGELYLQPPIGYLWVKDSGYVMDPDETIQAAIRMLLERFSVESSGHAVVKWARNTGFKVPTRTYSGGGRSEVRWRRLSIARMLSLLHNPVYAGVYAYGQRPTRTLLEDGEIRTKRLSGIGHDEWAVCIRDAHPGYITWEQYLANNKKIKHNATRLGSNSAPRSGAALLSGLLVCGHCGRRMGHSYWGKGDDQYTYLCRSEKDKGASNCFSLPGKVIDNAVQEHFLEVVAPKEVELSLAVQSEAEKQAGDLAQQWQLRTEKAEYNARLAERRYMAVDPDNRVVARTLESQWEQRLQELEEVRRHHQEQRRQRHVELSEDDLARIRALAKNLSVVWHAPTTQQAERKAMLRLVIEVVALTPVEVPRRETHVRIQWCSGAVTELRVPRPNRRDRTITPPETLEEIRRMAGEGLREEVIAERLNEAGLLTGVGSAWDRTAVLWVRNRYGIKKTYPDRRRRHGLPDQHADGRWSIPGAARRFGVSQNVVRGWLKRGLVEAHREYYDAYGMDVFWLHIDSEQAEELARVAERSRCAKRAKAGTAAARLRGERQ